MRCYWHMAMLLILQYCQGCIEADPGRLTRIDDGRLLPERWSEALTTVDHDGWRRLSSDALYVKRPINLNDAYQPTKARPWIHTWYRFWPSGHVLQCWQYTAEPDLASPSANDADDFSEREHRIASVGRYRVRGDHLEMEFIGYHEGGSTFVREKAQLNPDGSFTVFATQWLPASADLTCRPHPVQGMRRYPDW